MYRYVVITDPESAPGFRLTGLEVREADIETAAPILRACLDNPEVGLVALNDRFVPSLASDLNRRIETGVPPVVVTFPDLCRQRPGDAEEYLAQVIQRAIGYRIRLRG